jgi:hypothetical protein
MAVVVQRERLAEIKSYADVRRLRDELRPHNGPDLFLALFPIALDYRADSASGIASGLLTDLEPPCPLNCRDALGRLARGSWNPSDRLLPFYLITQFGKLELLLSVKDLLAAEEPEGQRADLEGVRYWAEMPTADLIAGHLEGQWREWRAAAEPGVAPDRRPLT